MKKKKVTKYGYINSDKHEKDGQTDNLIELLKKENCEIKKEYNNHSNDRPLLRELTKELQKGDTIVVYSIYDFDCSVEHLIRILHNISKRGANVYSIKDNDYLFKNKLQTSVCDLLYDTLTRKEREKERKKERMNETLEKALSLYLEKKKPNESFINEKAEIIPNSSSIKWKYTIEQICEKLVIGKTTFIRYIVAQRKKGRMIPYRQVRRKAAEEGDWG
jgi:DNA invertase Pin-like site-specific DNA recombinase